MPPPPQVCGAMQAPQASVPPQPSATVPQFAPASGQLRGTHGGAPHIPLTQGMPAGHGQLLTAPQPLATGPQVEPAAGAGHAIGLHTATPQTFGPPPPQVPIMQRPQSSVPPQPLPIFPHSPAAQALGRHAGAPHWLGTPPPPHD